MLTSPPAVYFVYPETCGVRLEDMDSLFGDATTTVGTPGMRSESESLARAGSPVPSLDLRGRSPAPLPSMDVNPPHVNIVDGKPQPQNRSDSRSSRGRVGEWLSRVTNRGASSSPASGARYAPLDQREE